MFYSNCKFEMKILKVGSLLITSTIVISLGIVCQGWGKGD